MFLLPLYSLKIQQRFYLKIYCLRDKHAAPNANEIGYYTGCPTRYRTRLAGGPLLRVATIRRTTDILLFISHTTNVLLFKFRCNIFIGVRIIKEMPGSVASGTHCIMLNLSNNDFVNIYIL